VNFIRGDRDQKTAPFSVEAHLNGINGIIITFNVHFSVLSSS